MKVDSGVRCTTDVDHGCDGINEVFYCRELSATSNTLKWTETCWTWKLSHLFSRTQRKRGAQRRKYSSNPWIRSKEKTSIMDLEWEHQSQLIQSNSRDTPSAARSRTIIPEEAIRSGSTIELRGTYPMFLYTMQVYSSHLSAPYLPQYRIHLHRHCQIV